MFDLNPLNNSNAWWQHVLMLVGAGILGYIIGYRSRRGTIAELEEELAGLDEQLDDCQKSQKNVAPPEGPAVTVPPVAAEAEQPAPLPVMEVPAVVAPEPMDTIVAPVADLPAAPLKHDNLKIVEGIGPKIEQLLNKEGIITFRHLSEATNERLVDILRAGGSRFHMHDPESWPQQAELAADCKWDELKARQEALNKGRQS
ncbi:hypothetical protein [Persicitalea jodogahamensis]|uniref:DUF4332 domain-containing protein n=1 Tax=Persicitalea jodogahamensis TaxID=402147 RepID=A0A8J3GAY9_9BACT|nr:hypothetical protein [Persicitalea jodogahamensis]GHB77572.1 hypothetical protein GCM10007390_34680 [Persicitalea jodogahamensis]